jgi:hypothetical protein
LGTNVTSSPIKSLKYIFTQPDLNLR